MIERVVVDDLRNHNLPAVHLRTSADATTFLHDNAGKHIGELWLDWDLGWTDTALPVVLLLEEACFNNSPFDIDVIYIHTANPSGADRIYNSRLLQANYAMQRVNCWDHLTEADGV